MNLQLGISFNGYFFVILFAFSFHSLFSQVVWTEPADPNQFSTITLYYDATEGNAALKDFGGDVYAHMGLITTKSTTPTDWKFVIGNWGTEDDRTLMTPEGNNIFSKTYTINEFHSLPDGEEVLQLAFVFRNANGTIVGRDADGSDIFFDLFPPEGLFASILSPQTNNNFLQLGDSLELVVQLSNEANVTILDNDEIILMEFTDRVETNIMANQFGSHELLILATLDSDSFSVSTNYYVIENGLTEDPPTGMQNGASLVNDSTIYFQLRAPEKTFAYLLCPGNDFQADPGFRMKQSNDGNTFWIELRDIIFSEGQNTYQYLIDGSITVADPFSKVVLDPFNDVAVSNEVMAELPTYPGTANGIVSVLDIETNEFTWTDSAFSKPENSNLVIYELMLRDFLADHSYKSLLDTLSYFQELGVNALELMPINEFEGNDSWGYNPSYHMAVDKYYGSRDQLKAVINAAHELGIAVILDVVFNHAFSQSPLAQMYWDPGSFRPSTNSPWLNVTPRHPFNVGYDFNHENQFTREWVKQILEYWIEEFHFDGFRFDLSKGLTQTNSGNDAGFMAQYDQSRIDILKDYSDHIWSIDSSSYVIMEHFADNDEEEVLADYGMMLWGNLSHDFATAAKGLSSQLRGADYAARGWSSPHLIAYMESHDEERLMRRILTEGDREGAYNTRNLSTALDRVEAASAIYYSIPGPKMLWQFGEFGVETSINRCVNGSISNNCRLDRKPILWDYLMDPDRKDLFNVTAALIHLKTTYPTFSTEDFIFDDANLFIKVVKLFHEEMDAVSIANFRIIPSNFNPRFPYEGVWYDYFSGDSIQVNDINQRFDFAPGEYRIYTSKPIENPFLDELTSSSTNYQASGLLAGFPNPVRNGDAFLIASDIHTFDSVYSLDLLGRRTDLSWKASDGKIQIATKGLHNGIHHLILEQGNSRFLVKLLVVE